MASLVHWLAYAGARRTDGTAVASGRAFFYVPGTVSTQATVYSDKDGLTAVTQPVALDAAGKAEVYAKVAVKVEVQESTGTVVKVSDRANTINASQVEIEQAGITGTSLTTGLQVDGGRTALSTLLGTLAGGFGANFAYQESATATSRSYAAAIGWAVTPQDFGALGNDSADDTVAFQAAINRAIASDKPLLIPTGTYRIFSALNVGGAGASGFRMIGANRSTSIIKNMNSGGQVLSIYAPAGGTVEAVSFENFTITAATTSSDTAMFINQGDGAVVSCVTVSGHRWGFISTAQYTAFQDCVVSSTNGAADGTGFSLYTSSTAVRCRATQTNGIGFYLWGPGGAGSGARASLCRATVTGGTGFTMAGWDAVASQCVATGCVTGFSVGAVSRAGATLCISTDASTADFGTNASATAVVDSGNTFTTRILGEVSGAAWLGPRGQIWAKNKTTNSGTSSFSWTPDPAKGELQILVYTGAVGGGVVVTINATATAGLVDGQRLNMLIHNRNGQSVTYNLNAQYVGAVPGVVATNAVLAYSFIWNGTAWVLFANYTTGSAVW